MTKIDFSIRRYCRQVGRCLPCPRADRKEFLYDFDRQLRRYAADHPGCTGKDLRAHFGKPKEVAAAYLAGMELPQVLKALNVRRRIAGVILAGILIAFAIYSPILIISCLHHHGLIDEGNIIEIIIDEDGNFTVKEATP